MAIKLAKKKRAERGVYFTEQIELAARNRKPLMDKIRTVRDYYYRKPGGFTSSTPWEGAVDIHLPVMMEKIETAVPKIVSAQWRADPFVNVRSPGGGNSDLATRGVEKFAGWAVHNDIPDSYVTTENFVRNMLIDGTSIGKVGYKRTWRHAIENTPVKMFYKEGDTTVFGESVEIPREKTEEEILAEVFGVGDLQEGGVISSKKSGNSFKIVFVEGGRKLSATVTFEETDVLDEINVRAVRKVIECDSPTFDLVDLEDFVVPFRAKSVQSASWVAQKTWYTLNEVRELVKNGDWTLTKQQLAKLDGHKRAYDEDSEVQADRDDQIGESVAAGTTRTTTDKRIDPNKVEIWEVYCRDYIEEIGEEINVIYYISEDLDYVVGAEYQDDIYPHGERPYIYSTYIPVPNRFYGISMAEILYAINTEVDHTISTVHNLTELIINPFYFYTPFAMTANGKLLNQLKPGTGVPTSDVNSVRFPEWSQQPLQLFHASFQTLMGYADKMTFSGLVAGDSNFRNAPRTARGTMYLGEQAEEKLSSIVEQLQATAWKDFVRQVISLYGRYVSGDKWFYVTGEKNPRRVSARDLRHNYMYEFSGSLTSVNREQQRVLAHQRYVTLRSEPLYQTDLEARRNLVRDFLKHMTEGEGYEILVPAGPGQGGFEHVPMKQEDEITVMSLGRAVSPLPVDDHAQHMKVIDEFRKSEAFGNLEQHSVALLAAHYRAHESLHQEQILMQQRALEMGMTQQGVGGDQGDAMPQPAPIGGEMSGLEGGPV